MKKKIITLAIAIFLLLPIFNISYFDGKSISIRRYSVVGIIMQDIKDGTIGTNF